MAIYALVIGVIAKGLGQGWLQDSGAYVFGLLVINFGIHYISKCAVAGPDVRGGLARAIVTGQRLAAHSEATAASPASARPTRTVDLASTV